MANDGNLKADLDGGLSYFTGISNKPVFVLSLFIIMFIIYRLLSGAARTPEIAARRSAKQNPSGKPQELDCGAINPQDPRDPVNVARSTFRGQGGHGDMGAALHQKSQEVQDEDEPATNDENGSAHEELDSRDEARYRIPGRCDSEEPSALQGYQDDVPDLEKDYQHEGGGAGSSSVLSSEECSVGNDEIGSRAERQEAKSACRRVTEDDPLILYVAFSAGTLKLTNRAVRHFNPPWYPSEGKRDDEQPEPSSSKWKTGKSLYLVAMGTAIPKAKRVAQQVKLKVPNCRWQRNTRRVCFNGDGQHEINEICIRLFVDADDRRENKRNKAKKNRKKSRGFSEEPDVDGSTARADQNHRVEEEADAVGSPQADQCCEEREGDVVDVVDSRRADQNYEDQEGDADRCIPRANQNHEGDVVGSPRGDQSYVQKEVDAIDGLRADQNYDKREANADGCNPRAGQNYGEEDLLGCPSPDDRGADLQKGVGSVTRYLFFMQRGNFFLS